MTIRLSTALQNKVLDGGASGGIKSGLTPCFCAIYQGTQPSSANSGVTGTLLGLMTKNGDGVTGMTWDAAALGVTSKAAAETWRVVYSAAGVAGFFRFYLAGDTITATDATKVRLDGSCGTSGADMNLSNLTTAVARVDTVDSFTVTLPSGE